MHRRHPRMHAVAASFATSQRRRCASSVSGALPQTYPTFTDAVEFQRDLRSVVARVPVTTFTEMRGQVYESVAKAPTGPPLGAVGTVDPAEVLKPGPITAANRRLHAMVDVLGHVATDEMLFTAVAANLDVTAHHGGRLSVALSLLRRLSRERRWPVSVAVLDALVRAFDAVVEAAERLQPALDLLCNLSLGKEGDAERGEGSSSLLLRAHPEIPDGPTVRCQTLLTYWLLPCVELLTTLGVLPEDDRTLRRLATYDADRAQRLRAHTVRLLSQAGRITVACATADPAETLRACAAIAPVVHFVAAQAAAADSLAELDSVAEALAHAYATATYAGAQSAGAEAAMKRLAQRAANDTHAFPRFTGAWHIAAGTVPSSSASSSALHRVNALVRGTIEPATQKLVRLTGSSEIRAAVAALREQIAAAMAELDAHDGASDTELGMLLFAHLRAELAAVHATARVLDAASTEPQARALALTDAVESAVSCVADTWAARTATAGGTSDESASLLLSSSQLAYVLEAITQLGRVPLLGSSSIEQQRIVLMHTLAAHGQKKAPEQEGDAPEEIDEEVAAAAAAAEAEKREAATAALEAWKDVDGRRSAVLQSAIARLFPLAGQLVAAAEGADRTPIDAPPPEPTQDPDDPRDVIFDTNAKVAAGVVVDGGGAEALEALIVPQPQLLGPLMEALVAAQVTDVAPHAVLLWSLTRPASGPAADVAEDQLLSLSIPEEEIEVDRSLGPAVPTIPTTESVAAAGMTTAAFAVSMYCFRDAANPDACMALRRLTRALYDPAADDVVLDLNGLRHPNPKGL